MAGIIERNAPMTRLMTLLDLAAGLPAQAACDPLGVGADLAADEFPSSPQVAADLIEGAPAIGADMRGPGAGDDLDI